MKAAELRIRTPEGIVFAHRLAGPIPRLFAWLVDAIVVAFLTSAAGIGFGLMGVVSPDLAAGLMVVGFFVIATGYHIALEWLWRGQTLGKRFFRLRVTDAEGLRLSFYQVLMRNLVRFVDQLPGLYLVGGATCLWSKRAQRLGDMAAATVVIHLPQFVEPDLDQLLSGKFNSLRTQPHLAARLRQHVSPDEARLALLALVRRDDLDPDARVRLFGELAGHFRTTVPFPPELTDSMPDEQYVRNVVDILFRTRPDRVTRPAAALQR